jgi:hypothetical protein
MQIRWLLPIALVTCLGGLCCQSARAADDPCQQVQQACLNAGFVQGAAQQGNGLFAHCVTPIMQGSPQPTNATKTLPKVDPQLVSACKAANPNFPKG